MTLSALDELRQRLEKMPPDERAKVASEVMKETKHMRFVPLPGPQTAAYNSLADVLLYGGTAGSGKSGLLVGLSQEHETSIIFRRQVAQTDGLERFGKEIFGNEGFNGTDVEWSWPDGRSLKLAGLKEPDSWLNHAGRARQYMGFDEGAEFLVMQVASLLAWLRGKPGQRCRLVLASNPPRKSEGAWVIDWFGPWLIHNHERKAKPGELRWAFIDPEKMIPIWVDGPESRVDGRDDAPLSFTFIPAQIGDNPYNDTPEYRAKLNSLPEPLRSQLRDGVFTLGGEDHEWQMIPTEWIKAAQDRWTQKPPDGVPMCAMGCDVAQGGGDKSTIATRYDGWYDRIAEKPGAETPSGQEVAALVVAKRKHNATIILDVGGGWGADAFGTLTRDNGLTHQECVPYMGVKSSTARSRDNLFRFTNMRTQLYWQFREALDPDQHGGSVISLPPDTELLADLAAMRYEVVTQSSAQHIKGEAKTDVVKRLGRSPDKGDAVVMAWFAGAKALAHAQPASAEQGFSRRRANAAPDYGPRRPHGMRS